MPRRKRRNRKWNPGFSKRVNPSPAPPVCPTPGKRRYATAEVATWKANLLVRNVNQEPYLCPCGFVHMTTVRPWRRPAKRA